FERDMRAIVRADEKIRAGRNQFLGIDHEHRPKLGVITAAPRVERMGHRAAGQRDLGMIVRTEPADPFRAHFVKAQGRAFVAVGEDADMLHSTVTLLARLRGWSTSVPLSTA